MFSSIISKIFGVSLLTLAIVIVSITLMSKNSMESYLFDQQKKAATNTLKLIVEAIAGHYSFFVEQEIFVVQQQRTLLQERTTAAASAVDFLHWQNPTKHGAIRQTSDWLTDHFHGSEVFIFDSSLRGVYSQGALRPGQLWTGVKNLRSSDALAVAQHDLQGRHAVFQVIYLQGKNDATPQKHLACFVKAPSAGLIVAGAEKLEKLKMLTQENLGAIVQNLAETFTLLSVAHTGYMFLFNGQGEMLIHPTLGAGKIADIAPAPHSENLFQQLTDVADQFDAPLEYSWSPTGRPEDLVDKIAYVAYFKPLDWYIAYTLPEDDIKAPVEHRLATQIQIASFIAVIGLCTLAYFIKKFCTPLVTLTQISRRLPAENFRITPRAEGMLAKMSQSARDESADLAQAFLSYHFELDRHLGMLSKRESALVEAQKELQSAFDSAWDGVLRTTLQGDILWANEGLAQIINVDSPALLYAPKLNFRDMFVAPAELDRIFSRLCAGEELVEEEARFSKRNKGWFWVKIRSRLTFDHNANAQVVDSYIVDISLEKLEKKLRIDKEAAEAANKAKTDFLAMISHEIKTPLSSILGMSEALRLKHPTQEQCAILNVITASGTQLLNVVGDILDLSKFENQGVTLENISFDLNVLMEEITPPFRHDCDQKQLEFLFHKPALRNNVRKGDPTKIKQIIANLLSNAVKFTHKGGVTLKLQESAIQGKNDTVHFTVADTGIGIPLLKQKEIFTPFAQADSSTVRKYGGSGLGLAITSRLTQAMGGEVWFESREGAGTEFHVALPLPVSQERPEPLAEPEDDILPADMDKLRGAEILVAEDFAPNRDLIKIYLDLVDARSRFVPDGREAVAAFGQYDFDLLFLDISMPGMCGIEVTRAVRAQEHAENRRKTPIIIQSAHAFDEFKQQCFDAGADDFLSKPFDYKTLLLMLVKHHAPSKDKTTETVGVSSQGAFSNADMQSKTSQALAAMVPRFFAYTRQQIQEGRSLLQEQPITPLADLAHGIKGAAGLYGFPWLQNHAEQLQTAAQENNPEQARTILQHMDAYITAFQERHETTQGKAE